MAASDFVLDIIAQGAWNGGTLVDNSIYENKGMVFKGGIPVTRETIEERIGVRTRMAASLDERIGVLAFQNLLAASIVIATQATTAITTLDDHAKIFSPSVRFLTANRC